jgi:hypothetical protein
MGTLSASFDRKIATAIAVAFVWDATLFQLRLTGGALGALELVLLAAALLARPALRQDSRAVACFGLAGLMALAMMIMPGRLAWTMFWVFAGVGTMLPATRRFGDAWCWSQRLLAYGLRSIVAPLLDGRRWLRIRHRLGSGQIRAILPQLALPAAGSAVILGLFAMANPVIETWLNEALSLSPDGKLIARLLMGGIWFTLAWSLLRPRLPRHLIDTFDGSGDLPLAGVSPGSVRLSLIAFNMLFALQNAMDLAWLWGLAPLPDGMTLAEYAHRGAYPLIVTALLAAGFVLVALRPGSQTAAMPAVRRLVVLWVAQNVLLVGNAALRTLDYIAAYSLTSLRIAALLWMGLVALGLMLVLWRLMRSKSAGWLINTNAAAALVVLGGCSFVDLDAVAARYNIAAARELGGSGAPLDICYLQAAGPSAMVALADLERRPAPEPIRLWARLLREDAQARLSSDLARGDWSLLAMVRLDEVRDSPSLAALAPRRHGSINCHSRDPRVLRAALGQEGAAPSPALTAPAER